MADIISELAGKAGVSTDLAQKGRIKKEHYHPLNDDGRARQIDRGNDLKARDELYQQKKCNYTHGQAKISNRFVPATRHACRNGRHSNMLVSGDNLMEPLLDRRRQLGALWDYS